MAAVPEEVNHPHSRSAVGDFAFDIERIHVMAVIDIGEDRDTALIINGHSSATIWRQLQERFAFIGLAYPHTYLEGMRSRDADGTTS